MNSTILFGRVGFKPNIRLPARRLPRIGVQVLLFTFAGEHQLVDARFKSNAAVFTSGTSTSGHCRRIASVLSRTARWRSSLLRRWNKGSDCKLIAALASCWKIWRREWVL